MTTSLLRRARIRSAFWCAAGIGVALAAATPAAATPAVRVLLPAGSEALHAGQLVPLRWEGLPADVDEMELLLEVDEQAAQRLRLTPQLAAATRSYLWRVPNLPGQRARLHLRWGRDGIETDGEPSVPFTIQYDSEAPLEALRFRAGEWWVADPLSTADLPSRGLGAVLEQRGESPQPATTPVLDEVVPGAEQDHPHRGLTPALPRNAVDRGPRGATTRCPLTIPLRP